MGQHLLHGRDDLGSAVSTRRPATPSAFAMSAKLQVRPREIEAEREVPPADTLLAPVLGDVRLEQPLVLSGDGGDELFAGYERFAAGLAARRYAALPGVVQQGVGGALGMLPARSLRGRAGSLQRFARVAALGLPDAYRSWISFVPDDERAALLDGASDDWGLDDYRAIWRGSEGARPLDRLLDLNLRTYLPDDLLVKADRMSMAHGLEVRSPFLDTELLTYAARLHPRLKARGLSLKRVLKAAVADLVPSEITGRAKRGFGVPLDRWFRDDLRSYLGSTLGAADARVKQHLVPGAVDELLAEHDAGSRNHGHAHLDPDDVGGLPQAGGVVTRSAPNHANCR